MSVLIDLLFLLIELEHALNILDSVNLEFYCTTCFVMIHDSRICGAVRLLWCVHLWFPYNTLHTLVEVVRDSSASFGVAFPFRPFPRPFLFADMFKQLNHFAASKLISELNCHFRFLLSRCPVSVLSLSCVCAASSLHTSIRVDVPHSLLASVTLVSHSRFVLLCCSSFVSHSSPS